MIWDFITIRKDRVQFWSESYLERWKIIPNSSKTLKYSWIVKVLEYVRRGDETALSCKCPSCVSILFFWKYSWALKLKLFHHFCTTVWLDLFLVRIASCWKTAKYFSGVMLQIERNWKIQSNSDAWCILNAEKYFHTNLVSLKAFQSKPFLNFNGQMGKQEL